MNRNDVMPGARVKVVRIEETMGMPIDSKFLAPKRIGVQGVVTSSIPQSQDDVWYVQHDGSAEIGAYTFEELAPV